MKITMLILLTAVIFCGCADDIVVKSPSQLPGLYVGEYIIEEKVGDSNPHTLPTQFVNWTFTDQQFWLEVDVERTHEVEICDFFGFYKLENEMEFFQVTQAVGTCSDESKAEGDFSFLKKHYDNAPDTLEMVQMLGSTRKTIRLVKVEE